MGRQVGRYVVHDAVASGGMGTVHFGRLSGPMGFRRTVAIKCLRPGRDAELSLMLLDEARVTARIQHPFVVPTLDVVAEQGELLVVMEYVHGESLARIIARSAERKVLVEPEVAVTLMVEVLQGLHAAHEAIDETGKASVSFTATCPRKTSSSVQMDSRASSTSASRRRSGAQTTRDGQIKGKLAYMSPEQLQGDDVDRRTDVFAAAIVLWELVTGQRLFGGVDEKSTIGKVLRCQVPPPSALRKGLARSLDAVVQRALSKDPNERFPTALEMAHALEACATAVPASRIASWIDSLCGDELTARRKRVLEIESGTPTPGPEIAPVSESTKAAQTVSGVAATQIGSRRRATVWVALAMLMGGGALAATAFAIRDHRRDRVPRSLDAPPMLAEAASSVPIASSAPRFSVASVTALPPAVPAPSRGVAQRARPQPSASSTRVDCTTPYTFDGEGHMKYRRECLQ